jgi:HlyD family secretion protein
MKIKAIVSVVVVALIAAVSWYLFVDRASQAAASEVRFRSAKVERGEVIEGVQASGAVQPVLLVQVGTQVSGVIEKLFVDFNSKVKQGQTIALLDKRRLEAQVGQDEAAVERASADLERMQAVVAQSQAEVARVRTTLAQAKADVDRVRALLTQATRDLERQQALAEQKLVSTADVDAAVASKGSLDAQLASTQAAIAQGEAQVATSEAAVVANQAQLAVGRASIKLAEAQLRGDRVNLDYATIVSPIDGVVVSRNVDVGQTVAASLSAPTLFVIANDLTKIQVQANVPEADLGKLHEGQRASFSVDAHAERTFEGVVSQIRLASTTVQNVVTYTVLVDASNPDGLLLPGMTANVTFEIARSAKDALRVPASALRLHPPPELLEPASSAPNSTGPAAPADHGGKAGAVVYLQVPGNRVRAIGVRPGISDGVNTVVEPVEPDALDVGADVVTAIVPGAAAAVTNPFGPPQMGAPTRGTGVR